MVSATAPPPATARSHHALSALLAARAAQESLRALHGRARNVTAAVRVLTTHQVAQAQLSERAVAAMLAEQEIEVRAQAALQALSFTTAPDSLQRMIDSLDTGAFDAEFQRLAESLVQSAGRAAENVAIAVRPDVQMVRYLSPPSCGRCAVLAGRVYRYSQGFLRHPNCDCTMIPVTVASPNFVHDPADLLEQGKVTGLSKADRKAIAHGADFNQVVNVRSRKAGLIESGAVLARAGRPTPETIYRKANTRDEAVELLTRAGYVR